MLERICVINPNSEVQLTFCSGGTDYDIVGTYSQFLFAHIARCLWICNGFGYYVVQISALIVFRNLFYNYTHSLSSTVEKTSIK